jgi:hypothetical protein
MNRAYTYRDGKLRSPWLRALNGAGAALEGLGLRPSLDANAMVAAATREAGSSELGGESYREPLEHFLASLEEEAAVSTFGRIVIRKMVVSQLASRIRLHAWTEENPEAAQEEIRRPWIIVGLPRTGTTLLSMLMGLDPHSRPLLQWEARSVVPPSTLATAATDPRIAEADKQTQRLHTLNPAVQAMHPFGAMLPEECIPFMMLDLRCLGMETQALVPGYGRWLEDCDMTPAYVQHKKALQALQTGQPTEQWVLKTPNHLWCLETLLDFYPDARIIWTHRDPGPVTTSVASLNATLQGTFARQIDPQAIGREWLGKLQTGIERGIAFEDKVLAQGQKDWCVHLHYSELMRDPLSAVRRIYAHFDEEPSPLHERRVEAWVREKPQNEFGRHSYDPADFGWSYEELAEIWQPYVERYGIEREK